MRVPRVYTDQAMCPESLVQLPEQASQHLTRVLRLDVGHPVILFNGDGNEYDATLTSLAKHAAQVRIASVRRIERESPLRITLVQAIARGEKMDWILQKTTELGVAAIVPLITERTEIRLQEERAERRLQHWRGVIAASCEQCGRTRLPELQEPQKLAAWVATLQPAADLRLALLPEGDIEPRALAGKLNGGAIVVVGPEGGLSEVDIAVLRAANFQGLRLGPRILRTETAGLAALSALQALAGDF